MPYLMILPVFLGRQAGSAYSTPTTLFHYPMANNADWALKFANGSNTRWAMGSLVPSAAAPDLGMNATDLPGRASLGDALQEGTAETSNAAALPAEARSRVLTLLAAAAHRRPDRSIGSGRNARMACYIRPR